MNNPLVIHLTRDVNAIKQSHVRRNEDISIEQIQRYLDDSIELYDKVSVPKVSFRFEDIQRAFELYVKR